jgi:hypothetical protein
MYRSLPVDFVISLIGQEWPQPTSSLWLSDTGSHDLMCRYKRLRIIWLDRIECPGQGSTRLQKQK